MIKFNIRILPGLFMAGLLLSSCAYFNTFYNARVAFDTAEKARIRKTSDMLPRIAKDNYLKVINKCSRIIEEYPDSKYVEEAEFLTGVARYHLGEIPLSQKKFEEFLVMYPESKKRNEAEYWIGLCRWKGGNPQYAILSLHTLLKSTDSQKLRVKILLSLADIHLELGENLKAMNYFEETASLSREKHEKVLINERISGLAFKFQDWDRAEKAYREVIRNSFLKDQKENAQLQIVKIYRLKDENEKAMNLIRKLLQDENFKTLHGDLELEMAKLYLKEKELDKAITRLKKVTTDYPKTASSAEAYFLLGEDALERLFDLDQALSYFNNIATEYSKSVYRPFGRTRTSDINTYVQLLEEYKSLNESEPGLVSDTTSKINQPGETPAEQKFEIEKVLFTVAELEYLQFKRLEESTAHYEELVELNTGSDLMVKSIYILSYLYEKTGQTEKKDVIEQRLLNDFPFTDYAGDIRKKQGVGQDIATPGKLLLEAENTWRLGNQEAAVNLYKDVIRLDRNSTSAEISYMFLANYYENYVQNYDSAYAYYKFIESAGFSDEYTKTAKKSIGHLKNVLGIEDIALPVVKKPLKNIETTPESDSLKLELTGDAVKSPPDTLDTLQKEKKVPPVRPVLKREEDLNSRSSTGKKPQDGEPSID